MGFFAQIAVSGLAAGSIYGLIAVGFSVTYSTTRTLNFALGMWVMLGAMLTYTFRVSWGMPLLLVMVLVVGCMWMLGIISERLTVGPFLRSGSDLWVMSTLAVGLIFIDVAELVWGHGQNRVPAYVGESPLALGNVVVMPQQVLNVVVVCTVYVGLHVFLKKNIIGKAFRAVAFDRQASGLMAINVPRIESLSYAASSAIAGLAGFLLVPLTGADAHMGTGIGFRAFAVAVVGGLESPLGILWVGLAYGVFEAVITGYINTGVRDIASFGVMILALAMRPQGLFGRTIVERA